MTTSGSPSTGEPAARRLPEAVVALVDAHLRQREIRRDELFERARRLRRLSQATMRRLHEGVAATAELEEVQRGAMELSERVHREGRGDESVVRDALQESVEAALLGAVVQERELVGPRELGVDPEVYLLGLGDLVGEVRRLALSRLAAGDLRGADRDLALMEELFHTLMGFDTTRAIVALKPKQDTARALVERTRGEITMARVLARASVPSGSSAGEP